MEENLANDCFISIHRNQTNPQLHPKSTLTFAHGDRRYDKMTRQMAGEDNVLRTKILIEINNDFHQGDKLNVALESDILTELVRCFDDEDDIIRELASRAIIKSAGTETGRFVLIRDEYVPRIRDLFDDKVVQIRANAYNSMLNIAEFTFGIDSIIQCHIMPTLVENLVKETDEGILILILSLLKTLIEGEAAPLVIQDSKVLPRLNTHLKSTNPQIRELSALNIGSISYNSLGKEQTIDAGSIEPLCIMLTDEVSAVRTASTRSLASLAQQKEGKVQIYDLDKLNEIIKLLYDDSDQTRLNTVQLICSVGEYPPAKEKFKECLGKLKELVDTEKDENPLVSRYAQISIDNITWTP